jgi:hypothetical protein
MEATMAVSLETAIEAHDIVTALRPFGLTQDDVALVTDVTTRAVRGWKAGNIRQDHYDRLTDLRTLVFLLSDSLTPRGVGQWLHARNRLLDGERAIDLLGKGESKRVEQAAQAFVEGAYV